MYLSRLEPVMSPSDDERYCWFHLFFHPFDGVSDGWMCHAWQPWVVEDGRIVAEPGRSYLKW